MCKESCNVLEPGDHGSTFGGNALATAAANATVRFMVDNDVPKHVREVGAYFMEKLEHYKTDHQPPVVDVRGRGLLLAMQFDDTIAPKLVAACNQEGLLLNPVRPDAIRFMPPLIISEADVDEAMEKLDRGLAVALAS
jgi:acetylornithine/succinyldiaminopimelate/putrescine aminotransferase